MVSECPFKSRLIHLKANESLVSPTRFPLSPSIARNLRSITSRLPPLNFITVHYVYFIGVCLLSSIIFWGSSTPSKSVNYTDSLFLVVSAMTLAGLNTINLSQLNTFQQFILFLLILLGSAIWVSIAVVHVRRKAFERKFKRIVEAARQKRRERSNSGGRRSFSKSSHTRPEVDGVVVRGRAIQSEKHSSADEIDGILSNRNEIAAVEDGTAPAADQKSEQNQALEDLEAGNVDLDASKAAKPLAVDTGVSRRITFASPSSPVRERQHGRILSMQGIGARQNIQNHPMKSPQPIYTDQLPKIDEERDPMTWFSLMSSEFVGRNSQFKGLTLAERERLGGVEYRALCLLAVLVPAYFILWQLLGCIGLGAYVAYNRAETTIVNAENPWYVQIPGLTYCC